MVNWRHKPEGNSKKTATAVRHCMWMNAVYSGATHHLDRQPNPRDQYHVRRHKLCAGHAGHAGTTVFLANATKRENMPRWDLVCAFNFIARTVDLALTHSNNALSFDNGKHEPPKNYTENGQKREHAHCTPSFRLRSVREILLFYIKKIWLDPYSILNYGIIIIITTANSQKS